MLLFRSEEHIDAWSRQRDLPRGGTLTLDQTWRLAQAWYTDRRDPAWRRRTLPEVMALFDELGMTGSFWNLAP